VTRDARRRKRRVPFTALEFASPGDSMVSLASFDSKRIRVPRFSETLSVRHPKRGHPRAKERSIAEYSFSLCPFSFPVRSTVHVKSVSARTRISDFLAPVPAALGSDEDTRHFFSSSLLFFLFSYFNILASHFVYPCAKNTLPPNTRKHRSPMRKRFYVVKNKRSYICI